MQHPNRGEVWLVDLGYVAKTRPCLVVSVPANDNDRALATLVPHTTSVRGTQFEVKITTHYLKNGAFDAQNLVTIPYAHLIRKLGSLHQTQLLLIDDALRLWLFL
jgi:mRNA interferase MazF